MKKTTKPTKVETKSNPKVIEITNIDQLQKLVDEPIYVTFALNGNVVRIKCRRITQALEEQVRKILRKVQPKWNEQKKDYDHTDPGYLELRNEADRRARSFIVYSCCPPIAAKQPGLTNETDIHRFVRELLTENIIELIHLHCQSGGMELVERANFTSTPASGS